MCGIVALLNMKSGIEPAQVLDRMLQTIGHRGPDDFGTSIDGPVALGFRRLSILDLTPLGHQPMSTDDDQYTLIFNGEIYNFVELRAELEQLGHRFRSQGDSEVLLAAYRQWGAACLTRLNGMWAFVIHDRNRGLLFGARDRFGMKPLFRWQQGDQAIFASEIKALRASGLCGGKLNLHTCAEWLYEGSLDETAETFYEGIRQVPAGHAFELTLAGTYREWSYWDIEPTHERPPADAAAVFAELFEDAVRVHMRSDVPVGVNLSGGLDSTSIMCAMARLRARDGATSPLLAFCYQDRGFDEERYIRDTLAQTGAQMVPLEMTPVQLWDSLPQVLAFHDEPVHTMTAIVGYHLSALAARNGVKVILNGQGADEVLGGYSSFFADRWSELVGSGHLLQPWQEIREYTRGHGGSAPQRFGRAVRHVAQSALQSSSAYRSMASRRHAARAATCNWLRADLARHLVSSKPRAPVRLSDALADAVKRAPLPLYLRVEDRNSMAHSVEVRLPFLDHRLVGLSFSLGSEWKIRGPWNKHLLREAMRGRIPESVRSRVDKMGFPTNESEWLRGPLYERMRDIVHDAAFRENPFFDAAALAVDLEAHRSGQAAYTERLFAAAQFHLWQQASGLRA